MKKKYLYTTAGLTLLYMYSNRRNSNHRIGAIVNSKPPGVTPCMDGEFSTYAPGGGVCSHHGGWTGVSRNKTKQKKKEPKELRKPIFQKNDVILYQSDYYLIPYIHYDEKYKEPFDGKYTLTKGHGSYDKKIKEVPEEDMVLADPGKISPYDNIRWYGVEGIERLPYYRNLDYQIAYRAYYWSSMSPDRRAKSQIKEYQNHLLSIYDSLIIGRNAEQILKIDTWFIPFVNKYHEKYTSWLHSRSNVASTMVTGPANFNVRKNEKANNAERNKYFKTTL